MLVAKYWNLAKSSVRSAMYKGDNDVKVRHAATMGLSC